MPRPTPDAELKSRYIRLNDDQWRLLQRLGGAEWLREVLDHGGRARPEGYLRVFTKAEVSQGE